MYKRRGISIFAKIIIIIVIFFVGYTIGRASNKNQLVLSNDTQKQQIVADLPQNADQFLEQIGVNNLGNISSDDVSNIVNQIRNSSIATYMEGIVGGFLNILRDVGINIER